MISLVDPLDLELPALGVLEVEDAERGGRLLLDTDDRRVRRSYAEAAAERAEERRRALVATGVDEIEVRVDRDVIGPLASYFRRRALRR